MSEEDEVTWLCPHSTQEVFEECRMSTINSTLWEQKRRI